MSLNISNIPAVGDFRMPVGTNLSSDFRQQLRARGCHVVPDPKSPKRLVILRGESREAEHAWQCYEADKAKVQPH